MHPDEILISAGEASGDLYASQLVAELQRHLPNARFFGCAGPRMRAAGVEPIVEAESLSVVGLVEVVRHIPRIYGEFRRLLRAAKQRRPKLAILTDSPDFHLRVATKLRAMGIPVVYLVAPQVWAWRQGRVKRMARDLDLLFTIFPFEQKWFADRGMRVSYIGHPLAWHAQPKLSAPAYRSQNGLSANRPIITLLPGSRGGEVERHLPHLFDAVELLRQQGDFHFVWATPPGFRQRQAQRLAPFEARRTALGILPVEGETWDAISHSHLVLAASGTVTMEAALLATPMVTFYRVTGLSWWMGKHLVKVPFYTMVNLVAERRMVPELMQEDCTGTRIAEEAMQLLGSPARLEGMRGELASLRARLKLAEEPLTLAAREIVQRYFRGAK